MGKSKLEELRANRSPAEMMVAMRLQQELLKATCEHCGQVPVVTSKRKDGTRWVICKGCGRTGKVVVKGDVAHIDPLTPDDETVPEAEPEAPAAVQKPEDAA